MTNPIIITGDNCSSFELRKLSKGYCWNIKVYHTDIQQGYSLAKQIDQQATEDYGIVEEIEHGE